MCFVRILDGCVNTLPLGSAFFDGSKFRAQIGNEKSVLTISNNSVCYSAVLSSEDE